MAHICRVFGTWFVMILRPVTHVMVHVIGLRVYIWVTLVQLRIRRTFVSSRGIIFALVTHKTIFSLVVFTMTATTIFAQATASSAPSIEAGQNSLLYALLSPDHPTLFEEGVYRDRRPFSGSYFASAGIEAIPGIDFDYVDDLEEIVADTSIPGSIALIRPGSDEPGVPGLPIVKRTMTEAYVVQSGDTIGSIARRCGVDVGTVIWANRLETRRYIQPGESLKIPATSGVLYTVKRGDTIGSIARRYQIDASRILIANGLTSSNVLQPGADVIIPGGVPPKPVALVRRSPAQASPDSPLRRLTNRAVDAYNELSGTRPSSPKPADQPASTGVATKLLWPTRLRHINQYYGWRHTGLDVEGYYTDPIYASADGVVEKAGWNSGGYGLQVLIDHENGIKTRYAHASKLFVQPGERVTRGQVIAMVGTTGRSTGTHLHYEVIVNGKRKNPLAYIR